MDRHVLWYLARSSGVVAWIVLSMSMVWGLLLSTRLLQGRRRPAWLLDLHKWLGTLAVLFTAGHLVALVADSYVQFGWAEILIPFASEWRPTAVAWGVGATYLMVAVQVTSWAMKRLSKAWWRRIHMTSYVSFFFASFHAAGAGSDAGSGWYQAVATVILGLVLFTIVYRLTAGTIRAERARQRAEKAA